MSDNRLVFTDKTVTQVRLDGKIVGTIKEVKPTKKRPNRTGWQYFPKGSRTGGEVFASKFSCMGSLYSLEK